MTLPEAELPALRWLRRAQAEEELLVAVGERVRRRRRRWLAAGTVCAALLLSGLWWNSVQAPSIPTAVITRPEERLLPDGSRIALKDGAQVEIDYSGSQRRVALRRGEAHFQVVKNERPFIVEVSGVRVQAVGTAFSVQLDAERVEVLVTEGRVQVAPVTIPPAATRAGSNAVPAPGGDYLEVAGVLPILGAGHRAIIPLAEIAPQISAVSATELAERLSWRIPNLEFSRTPLNEVVELMNQHALGTEKVQFVLGDEELRKVKLSGFLRADNSEGLVRLLENNFGVQAERAGTTITLHKSP